MTKEIHSESPTDLLFYSVNFKVFFKIPLKYLELYFKGNKRSSEKLSMDLMFNKTANSFSIW